MALSRQKKVEIASGLEGTLKDAESVVFVQFHGLSVADTRAVRRGLRDQGVGYLVAKKTLIRRALEKRAYEGDAPELPGEIALAYGGDSIAPARTVQSFAKQHKDSLTIVGGVFEGAYMGKEAMTEIALIPSRETLYAQLAMVINSPIQGLAVALNQIAQGRES